MKVIVDSSAWSMVLRRDRPSEPVARELERLVRQGRVQMLGFIRQELLSGIRSASRFAVLRNELQQYPDLEITREDHERAAECYNACRRHGVQGSVVDMLMCAVAMRHDLPIYTTDHDFHSYSRHLSFRLHSPRES